MDTTSTKLMLITANIGSLFEEDGGTRILEENWLADFGKSISRLSPQFIAFHMQEVGGKSSEGCKNLVHNYINTLYDLPMLSDFPTGICYLDEDYIEERYTAMGVVYLIHESLRDIAMWNFENKTYESLVPERKIHPNHLDTVFKSKFPLSCFSKKTIRWPRKGFIWSKWKIHNRTFDLVNIHLPHDACNVSACLKSPSKFVKHRKNALQFCVNKIAEYPSENQFLFGDFNVRPDQKLLVAHLMQGMKYCPLERDGEKIPYSLIYKSQDKEEKEVLNIQARRFLFASYEQFDQAHVPELLQFDKELNWCKDGKFAEAAIKFQPTFPTSEDPKEKAYGYNGTRCPSWCDRVLVDKNLVEELKKSSIKMTYESLGLNTVLGDHKPVFLAFDLPNSTDRRT